jgi:hypothetical protein
MRQGGNGQTGRTTVADRDPDIIRQEIDQAREQLASTVDTLAARANPRRLADEAKTRTVRFVKKPAVMASLAGLAALGMVLVARKVRNR